MRTARVYDDPDLDDVIRVLMDRHHLGVPNEALERP
jgi:hypothetical protein